MTKHTLLAALLASALIPAAAQAAEPGVLSYVKDHNVFIVNPDGSGLRAVTTDGTGTVPYTSASWAPDGTLWVGHGERFEHRSQAGELLGALAAPALGSHSWKPQPFDVEVSPDGKRLAFTRIGPGCNAADGCTTSQSSGVVDLTTGQELTGVWESVGDVAWVTNDRLAAAGPAYSDFQLRDLGNAETIEWSNDPTRSITELTISGDRQALAFVTEDGLVGTAAVTGDPAQGRPPAATIQNGCGFGPLHPGGDVDPVFGPDHRTLAFAEVDGIGIVPDSVHHTTQECTAVTGVHTVGEPGAHGPDWAAVQYDTAPRLPQAAPDAGTPGTGAGPAAKPSVTVKSSSRKAIRLAITNATPGRASAALLVKGRTVATGRTTVGPSGSAMLKLRLGKAAAKKLRRSASKATLKVTLPGQAPQRLAL